MANTLMKLLVELGVDSAGLNAGLDKAENTAKSSAKNIAASFSTIGASMMKTGAVMTAGLTLPIAAAGLKMVDAASSMDESLNKVNVVFGNSAIAISNWSKTAAMSMGISQQAALEAAGTYGNLFTALGLGEKDAADMSTSLVGLAADLASFNNANPEAVLLALRSGLSGEIEPMKKFGVAMNETIMKAKAMELGFGDNVQALTEAQKLQVRYAIIMQQTATAQGDFIRTSDGLANSTRIAKAQFADMAATLGTQLLPIALQVMQFLSGLIDKFNNLTPAQQKTVLVIAAIVAAIGPAITIIGGLISAIGAIIPVVTAVAGVLTFPLIAIIAAVIAVIALLYAAWVNNWGGIQEKTKAVMDAIVAIWNAFVGLFTPLVEAFQAAFAGDWETFGAKLREFWEGVWRLIFTAVETAIAWFKAIDWGQVGLDIIKGIANGITAGVSWIVNAARSAAEAAVSAAKGFLGIKSPSALFMDIGNNLMKGFAIGIDQAAGLPELAVATATSGLAAPSGREDIASVLAAMPRGGIDEDRLARTIVTGMLKGLAQQ